MKKLLVGAAIALASVAQTTPCPVETQFICRGGDNAEVWIA
jgi:hypothetical protein